MFGIVMAFSVFLVSLIPSLLWSLWNEGTA